MIRILKLLGFRSVFDKIYKESGFKGKNSISGPGSDLEQTRVIRIEIPRLLEELKAKIFLDIPCGDFYWMKSLDLGVRTYIGGDIVKDLIQINEREYSNENKSFFQIDLLNDPLPNADVLLCRDCLVHLSYRDIFKALNNIINSQITYLLTTTFTSTRENKDIRTGQWRPLNLVLPPFNFPEPQKVINEGCTENNEMYNDKALALWSINKLPRY